MSQPNSEGIPHHNPKLQAFSPRKYCCDASQRGVVKVKNRQSQVQCNTPSGGQVLATESQHPRKNMKALNHQNTPAPDFNIGTGGDDFLFELPLAPSHSNIKIWGGGIRMIFLAFRLLCGCCDSLANIRQKIEATSEIVSDFDLCMQQLNHSPLEQVGLVEAAPAGPTFCRPVFRIGVRSST